MGKSAYEKDLKYIKKHYGEKVANVCREFLSTVLETPGLLPEILDGKFEHSQTLGDELFGEEAKSDFSEYIIALAEAKNPKPQAQADGDAFEMMAKAGYILFPECQTEEDIQSFRKFYYRKDGNPVYTGGKPEIHKGEEICTFRGNRLRACRVWFAVKEGAEKLKRSDFTNPDRQDDYGTSVISIQFTRNGNILSIKNRYNHFVKNSDATFGNNLENIIAGLTQAWEKTFAMDLSSTREAKLYLMNYTKGQDGKNYRFNSKDYSGRAFCENNVIIDNGQVVKLPTHCILLDTHIFDLKLNRVITYDTYKKEQEHGEIIEDPQDDAFISSLGKIRKLEVIKGKDAERIVIVKTENGDDVSITFGKHNQILDIHDPNSTEIPDDYLYHSKNVRSFSAPKAVKIGNEVLRCSKTLQSINLPNVETIGNYFATISYLKKIDLPKLKELGEACFLSSSVTELNIPNLETMGDRCFAVINSLSQYARNFIDLVREDEQEDLFISDPEDLLKRAIEADGITEVELIKSLSNKGLTTFNAPSLRKIGDGSFKENDLVEFNAPQLQQVGHGCFLHTAISNFNCGVEIKQGEKPNLTDEEAKLFDLAVSTIQLMQNKFLGIEEHSQAEIAPQPVNTTQDGSCDKQIEVAEQTFDNAQVEAEETNNYVEQLEQSQFDLSKPQGNVQPESSEQQLADSPALDENALRDLEVFNRLNSQTSVTCQTEDSQGL